MERNGCSCLGCLGLIYVIGSLILAFLKYIVGAALSVFAIIGIITVSAGLLVGLFYAFKCFFMACFEEKDFKKSWKEKKYAGKAFNQETGKPDFYENYVLPEYSSYFRGIFRGQFFRLVKGDFKYIISTCRECILNIKIATGIKKLLSIFKNGITMLLMFISGILLSIVLGSLLIVFNLLGALGYFIEYAVIFVCDRLYYKINKIETRCTNGACKANFVIPIYACPKCGTPHRSLRPSKWGIFHRKCICGEMLPCLVHGKTRDKAKPLTRADFPAFCPECHEMVSGQSRPLGVALLGGVNSGKSTFKTAFLFRFIEESATNHKLDVELPDSETEQEYAEIKNYFRGVRAVPETRPDAVRGYDVKAFNFSINHNSFSEKRMIQMYDMPGEVFEQDNAQDRMEHFRYVEGLIFLLDPYSLTAVAGEREGDDMRTAKMDIDALTSRLIAALEKVPNVPRSGGKISIPVAVCINKVDTLSLRNRIGIPASERLMQLHPDQFKNRYDAMDYLCRAFMCTNDKGNAVMTIDQNFSTVHYFSCSSMGYVPKGGQRIRFTPENVEAAVCWLFSRADRRFDKVFSDYDIRDIPEKKKELGRKQTSYYDEIVTDLNTVGGKD